MSITIDYYNKHAGEFSDSTRNVPFKEVQERFLSLLPSGADILDFGCGSGRDTKYFLGQGYHVRYFTDFTLETFSEFIADKIDLSIKEHWITADVRPGRGKEEWLNIILEK